MKEEYKDFRNRLHQACDDAGVPSPGFGRQTKLAADLKVSQEASRKWLNGESIPRKKKLEELAKYLGVDSYWLAFGEKASSKVVEKQFSGQGAENLVSGLLSMLGGTVGHLKPTDAMGDKADLVLTVAGKTLFIEVKQPSGKAPTYKVRFNRDNKGVTTIVPFLKSGTAAYLYSFSPEEIGRFPLVNGSPEAEVEFDFDSNQLKTPLGLKSAMKEIGELYH